VLCNLGRDIKFAEEELKDGLRWSDGGDGESCAFGAVNGVK
jgi:hypothetical protein